MYIYIQNEYAPADLLSLICTNKRQKGREGKKKEVVAWGSSYQRFTPLHLHKNLTVWQRRKLISFSLSHTLLSLFFWGRVELQLNEREGEVGHVQVSEHVRTYSSIQGYLSKRKREWFNGKRRHGKPEMVKVERDG